MEAADNRFLLPSAKTCKAYAQGRLDGLCGLYAAINAIQLVRWPFASLRPHEPRQLFEAGLYHLQCEADLAVVARHGMDNDMLLRLTRKLCRQASVKPYVVTVRRLPAIGNAAELDAHIIKALNADMPVIVNLSKRRHYSIISGYSKTRYVLFDSYGGKAVTRPADQIEFALMVACKPRPAGWRGY